MLNILAPILFALTPVKDTNFVKVHTHNYTQVHKIGDRDPLFGVKENIEELLIEKGYTPIDSGHGFDVHVSIDSIYSPQQVLNIVGMKWLRKDYIVETTICIGSGCFNGKGERKTFIFAMFLDVEGNEIPLNRKAFSKALQEALTKTTKQF
jgi:hypothetical protein